MGLTPDPWEHVLAIGLGSAFGNAMAKWEVKLQEDLDKKLLEVQNANNKRYIGWSSFLRLSLLIFNFSQFLDHS